MHGDSMGTKAEFVLEIVGAIYGYLQENETKMEGKTGLQQLKNLGTTLVKDHTQNTPITADNYQAVINVITFYKEKARKGMTLKEKAHRFSSQHMKADLNNQIPTAALGSLETYAKESLDYFRTSQKKITKDYLFLMYKQLKSYDGREPYIPMGNRKKPSLWQRTTDLAAEAKGEAKGFSKVS